jgi:signal transduction histidine kinase
MNPDISNNKTAQKEEENDRRYSLFLSMTTHDLMAPMRKLGVLTDRLVSKFEQVDDEEVNQYTRRIHTCIEEMKSILNACRMIAEAVPENMHPEMVDTGELLQEILNEYHVRIKEEKVEITLTPLPTMEGDRIQLGGLFRELIENALVFSKKDLPLKLEISAGEVALENGENDLPGGNYWKFVFSDNGIGFKQEESERIFHPTVRLHGKSAFPGNGLGLTLVKKIAGNHGGAVCAESEEGKGSRFILIFPKTQG